jgi:hypothetical protein
MRERRILHYRRSKFRLRLAIASRHNASPVVSRMEDFFRLFEGDCRGRIILPAMCGRVQLCGMRMREVVVREKKPNKAPEPTTGTVTPRAMPLGNSNACPAGARVAPVPVVAHL